MRWIHRPPLAARILDNPPATVTVTGSVSSNNGWGFAVHSDSAARAGSMLVSRSTASHNSHDGFSTLGGFAEMIVSSSVSSRNAGGFTNYGGYFFSLGDNTVLKNNSTDIFGVITTAPLK